MQARNFAEPSNLAGLSIGTILLGMVGNALMLPRALLVQDAIWIAGASWACFAMWLQTLSMYLGHSPATGLAFVPGPLFAAVSALLLAFVVTAVYQDARLKGKITREGIQLAPSSKLN